MRAIVFILSIFAMSASAQSVTSARGAELRVLDKSSGVVRDLTLAAGDSARIDLLEITLKACRYPEGRIEQDAYAEMTIHYDGRPDEIFTGWMFASSPALNALDHPRYDVWVLRCAS